MPLNGPRRLQFEPMAHERSGAIGLKRRRRQSLGSCVAYDSELNPIAAVNLGKIEPGGSNSTIQSLKLDDDHITVVWDTQGPQDPSAIKSVRATATLIVEGSVLVADGDVTQVPVS